jgi:Transglycosylase SLT domain
LLSIWACASSASAGSPAPFFTVRAAIPAEPGAAQAGRAAGTGDPGCLAIRAYDEWIQASVKRWWPDYPLWLDWRAQLCQESRLDPGAISPAGAAGLAQFMPDTWADVSRRLGYGQVSPHVARFAIEAGAYYMASLRRQWSSLRPAEDRQALAQASYNTGMGNVLRAQKLCRGARSWTAISGCLPLVTGRDAQQTIDYVRLIALRRRMMEEAAS